MEKAVLKTLVYADIFDYPLKINEIHKWLIGRKVTLQQVEKTLRRLNQKLKIKNKNGYYFLSRRHELIVKRNRKEKQSIIYLRKAKLLSQAFKIIPWIKLTGISGGLAVNNASKKDDIDLFIITSKNRLWISRFLVLGLLSLTGQRRKRFDRGGEIAGKFCVNILLEEGKLEQENKDLFIAHEVLQMRVLWQRDSIYSRYLAANEWVFKFLPNWTTSTRFKINDLRFRIHKSSIINHKSILDYIETLAKKFQLWYMKQPIGLERITDGALYFHPNDCRLKVLSEFRRRITRFNFGTP